MKALVTGGGGFLGGAIVKLLVAEGFTVRSLARNVYPELQQLGVAQVAGSLDDFDAVCRAVDGCDLVFHVAAKAGVWGSLDDYFRPNVIGTRYIIEACRKFSVKRLCIYQFTQRCF